MKKIVLKLDLQDDKAKQKALKTVSTLSGIDSIAMEMKEKKMTVMGTVDAVTVVSKLRKHWPATEIVSVGPAKEPEKEKKEDPKKEGEQQPKKEEEEAKKDGDKKEEEKKKDQTQTQQVAVQPQPLLMDPVMEMVKAYKAYNPHLTTHYYVQSMEENPNACVIS